MLCPPKREVRFNKPYFDSWSHLLTCNLVGYSGVGGQQLDPRGLPDCKESFYISEDSDTSGNQYPCANTIKDFRAVTGECYDAMITLSQRVLRLLAGSLGLTPSYFDSYSGADGLGNGWKGSTLRLVHYPPKQSDSPPGQLACGAHTDFGCSE